MTAIQDHPQAWSKRRWSMTVGIILAFQVIMIFWLGAREKAVGTTVAPGLHIRLPSETDTESVWPENPILFVSPNRHGFSGEAWLYIPTNKYIFPDWTEPPRLLSPPIASLGGSLAQYVRTNETDPLTAERHPEPQFASVAIFLPLNPPATQSTLWVEGELANRQMLTKPNLNSWPASDSLLTNSVVRVGVDSQGRVFTSALLARSGSIDADNAALQAASEARFQAAPNTSGDRPTPPDALTWGRMVFHWLTTAMPSTNSTGANP